MKADILFTIVIPTYNRADLIIETIQSVLDQTYKNYEIIVVDNCSTDNTEDVLQVLIEEFKIKFIKHDKNYERSKSRNTGINYASGDYLTFLDSDDFMYESCLKDAADFIDENPEIKFFQNLYELVDDNRNRLYSYNFPNLDNQFKALANGNFISCIGGFIHKDVYQNIQFNEDPKMIGSEDYEVWFRVLADHYMGRVKKINSGIRQHLNRSVNQGVYQNLAYQGNQLVNIIKNDQKLFSKFGPYLNILKGSFLLQEALVLRQLQNRKAAVKRILRALKINKGLIKTKRFYSVIYNIIK